MYQDNYGAGTLDDNATPNVFRWFVQMASPVVGTVFNLKFIIKATDDGRFTMGGDGRF